MKKLLTAVSALAIVSFAYPVTALSLYTFELDGWSDGGVFSGSFIGDDLNNDGQLTSFNLGEVSDFSATYSSSEFELSIDFNSLDTLPFGGDFPIEETALAATGLVFTLDGTGQLGDDFFGDIEGLGVFSNEFYLAVGAQARSISATALTSAAVSSMHLTWLI